MNTPAYIGMGAGAPKSANRDEYICLECSNTVNLWQDDVSKCKCPVCGKVGKFELADAGGGEIKAH